ncbi:hypothetical protein J2777_005955 [Paraburkholderia graminis]|uniref:hypothetical protein n=1 Tax=Paraburkholderia graminis TaxID=60548 RepID=UPI0028632459|nr:hypothetical protein [Paraburkholderia graminis]MDR6472214.1 hypothetical protein [Paraburkholderia graminis]
MSALLGDYDRLLATAIWLFFASGLLMLKSPGNGVAYLGPRRVRVRFPSWRAAFGRRLALVVYPIHSFWPMAEVELRAASRNGAMDELAASAQQLERPMRLARPFLLAVTFMVAILIPFWVLYRGADFIFLAMGALAYVFYGAGLVVLLRSGVKEDRSRIRAHWKTLLEPLLCLPYGAHLCRKLSERYRLSVPLVDLLRSNAELSQADLEELSRHIDELKSVSDDADELAIFAELHALLAARLAGLSQ